MPTGSALLHAEALALLARGLRRHVLGRSGHARARARGDRALRPGLQSVLARRDRGRARCRSRSRRSTSASTTGWRDADENDERRGGARRPRRAVQPDRGPADSGLRPPRPVGAGGGQPADGRPAARGGAAPLAPTGAGSRGAGAAPTSGAPCGPRCGRVASRCGAARRSPAPGRGGSCCSPTSADRWSPTAGRWSGSPTWPWPLGPRSRRSPSGPG